MKGEGGSMQFIVKPERIKIPGSVTILEKLNLSGHDDYHFVYAKIFSQL